MKHFRLLALLLALMLCLTSCDGSTSSAGESPDATIPAEALEDVVYYLTDGTYTKDSVLVTVGDTPISAAHVLYWIAYQQYNLVNYYYNYGGVVLNMDDEMDNGLTVGQYLFEFGLSTATAYAVGNQKAIDEGTLPNEDTSAALDNLYEDNVTAYGKNRWDVYLANKLISEADFTEEEKAAWIQEKGAEFYQHSMMYYATTPEAYGELNAYFATFGALQDAIFGEGGEYALTEDSLQDCIDSYISDNGIVWARCILFPTMELEEGVTEDDVLATAQSAFETLSALEGQALSEKFTVLQAEHDQSGYNAGEIQRYSNADSLVDGFYDGVTALQPGEIALTEKTDYGYFILLREEDQRDAIAAEAEANYLSVTWDDLITQWIDDYGAKPSMELNLDSFYTKLAELQQKIAAVDTVATVNTTLN